VSRFLQDASALFGANTRFNMFLFSSLQPNVFTQHNLNFQYVIPYLDQAAFNHVQPPASYEWATSVKQSFQSSSSASSLFEATRHQHTSFNIFFFGSRITSLESQSSSVHVSFIGPNWSRLCT